MSIPVLSFSFFSSFWSLVWTLIFFPSQVNLIFIHCTASIFAKVITVIAECDKEKIFGFKDERVWLSPGVLASFQCDVHFPTPVTLSS